MQKFIVYTQLRCCSK